MEIVDELMQFKQKIELAEDKKSKAEWNLQHIQGQLKDMGFDDFGNIDEHIEKLEVEIEKKRGIIEKGVERLRGAYDWD